MNDFFILIYVTFINLFLQTQPYDWIFFLVFGGLIEQFFWWFFALNYLQNLTCPLNIFLTNIFYVKLVQFEFDVFLINLTFFFFLEIIYEISAKILEREREMGRERERERRTRRVNSWYDCYVTLLSCYDWLTKQYVIRFFLLNSNEI